MGISREAVIATALGLLDEVGLEGLTMRRLADALDIKAASLYWHFANKQVLLDGMADALMAGVAQEAPPDSWRDAVGATARAVRAALLARRDGARVFAGTYVVTDNVLRVAESMIGPLRTAGASTRMAGWGAFSILYYVLGFVMEEQALDPAAAAPIDAASRRGPFEELAAQRYPHVLAAMDDLFDMDFETRFEAGLDLILTGLDVKLKAGAG
ncbi:TetR/AcrR family transcriptional regulator C-terminal domain-containing protein [Massilia pseudoviolaceinigra]|uniref:TetR/AcrR family transcriptional regulator C-terminal domain-containing protein n=1 Tax=Massilia pseudoviolaceinigra TaxID=3057165 RepID=UPI0027964DD5|nr:TetR/AcrR family transcriptional regulator C-terminal domain-containing protein [Massilia sp. CCM 9206]MDQ1921110.1 TetR/AcrR family transcriptional regulator C-terminal domain-containing protein [Massilia sp. CCM 9206]